LPIGFGSLLSGALQSGTNRLPLGDREGEIGFEKAKLGVFTVAVFDHFQYLVSASAKMILPAKNQS
jgi:hypothetical protein